MLGLSASYTETGAQEETFNLEVKKGNMLEMPMKLLPSILSNRLHLQLSPSQHKKAQCIILDAAICSNQVGRQAYTNSR